MLTWQRLAAVRDSHDGYALMLRTCNPSMRCRDWLMVGLPGLTAGWLSVGLKGLAALLFPSLPLFPSLLRRRPVSLGPLSGFARRLQSPVEAGTPARRRSEWTLFLTGLTAARCLQSPVEVGTPARRLSEGTLFLNRLDCWPALAMPDAPLQAIPDALMGS